MADIRSCCGLLLVSSFAVFIAQLDTAAARSLPSFIKPCKRTDPNLGKCILKSVEKLRPNLKAGIPELQLPSYDPLVVPSVQLKEGSRSKSVRFTATFTDLHVHGAHDSTVKAVSVDLKKPMVEVKVSFPNLRIKGDYVIDGQILVLPITGNGKGDSNFTNVDATITLSGKYVEKKKKQHIQLTKSEVTLTTIGHAQLDFDNLFNGNKELGDVTNRFINQNWQEILKEIKPLIQDTIAELIVRYVTHIFDTFSMDDILPEN